MPLLVSIIIPTFNREAQLQRTLYYLAQLPDGTHLFEILVVDNGSTDSTASVVEEFGKNNPGLSVRYFYDPVPGLLTGRHRGAKESKGEILTFIDDDVHVSKQWLSAILTTMQMKPEVMLLTGPNFPLYEVTPPDWINMLWQYDSNGKYCGWYSLLDFGTEEKEIDPIFVWGLNFTIRRDAFEQLKGFHPDNIASHLQSFQGDGETGLSIKANENGMMAWYNPEVRLFHEVQKERLTLNYLKKRAFYQGVCDSYTQIRREHGLYKPIESVKRKPRPKALRWVKSIVGKLLKIKDKTGEKQNQAYKDLLSDLCLEQERGFQFHRSSFNTISEVREWVLQEEYYFLNQQYQP